MEIKNEIEGLIKMVGTPQNGGYNSDGEYTHFCNGDEEWTLDLEDIDTLSDMIVKLAYKKIKL